MKVTKLLLVFGLMLSCIGCGRGEPLTPEEQRLQRIASLDSTLHDFIFPDSIDGFGLLEGLSAEAWMLVEDSTGFIVSQKNADRKLFIASLTKMMTCLLALENGNPEDTLYIMKEDFATKDSRIRPGDGYLFGNLIREMMLVSDNNAAYAVARHIAGDTLAFYGMMNEKAHYLGMDSTHYSTPNGMPSDDNYSCASDLMRLSRYCMSDSIFREIVGTKEADIPLLDGRHLPCVNTNRLLTTYDGCFGVKTGYTRQAAGCLVSAATRDGATLHLVLLGCRSKALRFKESALLLDYGFSAMKAYREKVAKDEASERRRK